MITKSDYLKSLSGCQMYQTNSLKEIEKILDIKSLEEMLEDDDSDGEPMGMLEDFLEDYDENTIQMVEGRLLEAYFKKDFEKQGLRCIDIKDMSDMKAASEKTKQLIESGQYDIIFEATFIGNINGHKCVARVDAFDVRTKTLIELKNTSNSKVKYIFDIMYQYRVIEASGVLVPSDVRLALMKYKEYKKGQMEFVYSNKCSLKKNGSTPSKAKIEAAKKAGDKNEENYWRDEYQKQLPAAKVGELDMPDFTIFDLITGRVFPEFGSRAQKMQEFMAEHISKDSFYTQINKVSRNVKTNATPTVNAYCKSEIKDCDFIGKCKENAAKLGDFFYSISGTIVKFDKLLKFKSFEEFVDNNCDSKNGCDARHRALLNKTDVLNKTNVQNVIKSMKKKVFWYDFETINPAIPSFDGSKPHAFAVFQLSYVITIDGKETEKDNIVIDTADISIDKFEDIIDRIYQGDDYSYVVYNKGFENSRISEIARLSNRVDLQDKVTTIIENTIDLMDIYNTRSAEAIGIFLWEALGFYSIKKIEKYITKHKPENVMQIKPYTELKVPNGTAAMDLGLRRYYNLITQKEWETAVENLKEYCENDVYAMIMVYELACKILKDGLPVYENRGPQNKLVS